MKNRTEIGINLKYTDETGTQYFNTGDKVICYAGEKKYDGKITRFAKYNESDDFVVCIDTSTGKTSCSEEFINIKDITSLYKNPLADSERPYEKGSALEQGYMDTLAKIGCNSEEAKAVYDRMRDTMIFYCIPTSKAMSYAIHAFFGTGNDAQSEKNRIRELAQECCAMAVKEYFDLIEVFQKSIGRGERAKASLLDVLNVVSRCWDALSKQDKEKMSEIIAEAGK